MLTLGVILAVTAGLVLFLLIVVWQKGRPFAPGHVFRARAPPPSAPAPGLHGELLYASAENLTRSRLWIWDLETGAELKTLSGHTDGVDAVALSADGRRAVSGSGDKTLKVWDLETGAELKTLSGHTDEVYAVAVGSDGRRAISRSGNQTLKVWDINQRGGRCHLFRRGHNHKRTVRASNENDCSG